MISYASSIRSPLFLNDDLSTNSFKVSPFFVIPVGVDGMLWKIRRLSAINLENI